jgi:adenylyl-sulfate kinase
MSCSEHKDNLLVRHAGLISLHDRANKFHQKPLTIWMTGLSASGKSTLAYALESKLYEHDIKSFVLDGDNIRHGINKDLGFSEIDRSENIRRVAEVAHLMNEAGLVVICAFICPSVNDRLMAKEIVGSDRFFEVYLNTPIETCEARDPKMLYKKARSGELKNFTGVSAPYYPPETPDVSIDTSLISLEISTNDLFDKVLHKISFNKEEA